MAGCSFCSTTRTDVIRVRDGDYIADKLRAFGRQKFRFIPAGDFHVCPTCLGEVASAKPYLSLQIKKEIAKEKEKQRVHEQ